MEENFQEYCQNQVDRGNQYASKFLKKGKNALQLALDEARRKGLPQGLIEKVEEKGMLNGSFELTYEGAKRIYDRMQSLVQGREKTFGKDYMDILNQFDPIRDSDLIATGLFCLVPEIREKVHHELNGLYKVVLSVGNSKKQGYALPDKEKRQTVSQKNFFPLHLRDLLAALPKPESDEDSEYQRMLHLLIQKKAERDVFPAFKQGEASALRTLEKLAREEKDENVRAAYQNLAHTYQQYLEFQIIGENPNFRDPETGEKDVLPSLHQKIGIYHLLNEKRLGIWDGGGTGKTAIATLAQPLIEEEFKRQGKEFRRAIIVGSNLTKKAWKKGLLGNKYEKYLKDEQNAVIVNGEKKTDEYLDEIGKAKWIMLNYEQLIAQVDGSNKLFIDALIEQGVDYVVFDESHNIKSLRERTKGGRPTYSAAARALALNSEYFTPMSATPISNGLLDFAVQYHLINPVTLQSPDQFMEMIQNSPRVLYTFFHDKSVRRTSEDINADLNWDERENTIDLDPIQRKVYNHIIEFRPEGWLQQARKALLDPRLVDPEILRQADALGEVTIENSSKYKKLEELITAEDGPIANNEKFIIFSTMFREGVTQKGHEGLRKRYEDMGISDLYDKLELDVTVADRLNIAIKEKRKNSGSIGTIDGTILKVEDREKVVERLRTDLEGIICTTETGGESLDFTAASYAYFLDEDYVPDTEQQALWRLLRRGQKKKVHINHLRAKDSLDEQNREYVDKKRVIAKMAMDGVPPTQEEWHLLSDTEGKRFGDLVRKSIGGTSINVYEANIENSLDFTIKKRLSRSRKTGGTHMSSETYMTTDAQEIMKLIGQDPVGCWKDPAFVELYMKTLQNMAPPVIHSAKIIDLVRRAQEQEISFPKKVLSDGSGPSLLYDAYQRLRPIVEAGGYKIPTVFDRDFSQLMLNQGANPNKVFGLMTGEDSSFNKGEFDMVDNESISLLRNSDEVHSHLLEANRILKPNGLVELVVKNMKFSDEFYSGMETLGFELLSGKNEGFALSKDAQRRIKKINGEHFAESYASKLANTYVMLARRIDNPAKANPKDFWFDRLGGENEPEKINAIDPSESRSIITPRSRRKGGRPQSSPKISDVDREITVDKFGVVQSVKKRARGKSV